MTWTFGIKSIIEWSEGEPTRMRKLVTFLLVIPTVVAFVAILIYSLLGRTVPNTFTEYFFAMLLGSLASVGIYMGTKASSDTINSQNQIIEKVENALGVDTK